MRVFKSAGDKPNLRDYYCSHSAKGYYYWHPYDLVVQRISRIEWNIWMPILHNDLP